MNASIEKYIKIYNWLQLTGWTVALLNLPFNFSLSFYLVAVIQTLALVEVFHAQKKWIKSPVLLVFVQTFARIYILFWCYILIWMSIFKPINYLNSIIIILLTVWCVAEIIRYAYYTLQLYKNENKLATWLRYNVFIICYPIGVACEILILVSVFKNNELLIVKLCMIATFLAYIIYFPKLFKYLLKARQQKLNLNLKA